MKCNSSQRFVCCVHSNSFQRISSIMDLAWPGDRSQVTNCTFFESMKYTNGTPLFWHGKNNPYPICLKSWCVYLWQGTNSQTVKDFHRSGHDCMMALESSTLPWQFFSNSSDRSSFQLFISEIQRLRFPLVNWIFFLGGRDNSLVEANGAGYLIAWHLKISSETRNQLLNAVILSHGSIITSTLPVGTWQKMTLTESLRGESWGTNSKIASNSSETN